MEVFNLQDFVTSPSVEQINLCRKQDLLQIADHFQIVVSKQSLKKEIKRILILRLNELQVLPTSNVGGVETGGDVNVDGVVLAHFSSGEKDKWSGGADADAKRPKLRPAYHHLSRFHPVLLIRGKAHDWRSAWPVCIMKRKREPRCTELNWTCSWKYAS